MDQITASCVKEFLSLHEIPETSEAENFEKFTNYCIISKEYNGHFNVEDISTDEGTQGIDGIGVIVNGKLIDDVEEIDDLIDLNRTLDVLFVFIQAKTSNKFEGSEIGNFAFAVKQFFADNIQLFPGPKIANFRDLKNHI